MASAPSSAETLKNLIRRLDQTAVEAFTGATNVCATRTNYEVAPEHLLLRLLDDASGDVTQIVNAFKLDRARIRRAVLQALDQMPVGHRGRPALSPKLVEIFSAAVMLADDMGFEQVRTGLLLLALALNPGHTRVAEFTPELQRIDVDQLRDHFHEIVAASGEQAGEGAAAAGGPAGPRGDGTALAQYTIDLTAKATDGKIDPVFGRDFEIRQMIDIFARRRKNNPILVGEPGTGKTAIVEGLALRIVQGDVPPVLRGVRLLNLDMGLLQAGAGVKGEFENRLKNVIKEVKASETPCLLFIDEAHTLIGAGGSAGTSDAANLLKPALARGELRTVAATTWAEYKKYFEKDAALERRFQLVRVEEPNTETAVVMLRGSKDTYEKHHKVVMLDEAVTAAVTLSQRYITGRFLPDKAVDLLDTTAARVAVALTTKPGRLDDIDRNLGHLDSALEAMARDKDGGMSPDEKIMAEMRERRAGMLSNREKLEAKWQAELAGVQKVNELRSKLPSFKGRSTQPNTGPQVAKADGKTDGKAAKPAAEPKPEEKVDDAAIRKDIDLALKELTKLQGDDPLLFPQVDAAAVASVVADWTGVPVGNMVKDEISAMLVLEDRLRTRVVGQDEALTVVAQKLRTARSGLGNPQQPMGVFLLVGPSGTGKTELATTVAEVLFGGADAMTTINMSEFMESHTVSALKGSPPGYVGYGEGGVLTEAVRQRPYTVVLLDEVEKAHKDVMNLFYQVFDKGMLADGEGRVIDFKNTVIFLTSNLGTDVIQQMCESGEPVDFNMLKEGVYPHLREHFKPALVARMTVVPFRTLGAEILKSISKMKLGKVAKRLTDTHKIAFSADEKVYENIAGRCTQVDLGARQVDHAIDQAILPTLSRQVLEQMSAATMPTKLHMNVDDAGEFTYEFTGAS